MKSIATRLPVLLVGLAAALLARGPLAFAADALATRANVLLIVSDDLNDWVLHPQDHPEVQTPNMDRLRNRSVSFSNAHVVVPVCGPSRKCLFSGLYPQTLDDYGFARWRLVQALEGCIPMPLHFRNNGYDAYGTGKLLHEGAGGDFYTAYGIGPDYGPWPWQGKGKPMNTPHPAQFDTWESYLPVNMHRDLNYGPLSNVPEWKPSLGQGIPGAKGWYNESGKPFKYVDANDRDRTPDEISADWAAEILGERYDRPFFLAVGFVRPHTPLYAPKKYFDMYPLEEIQLPPYKKDDLNDCASILRRRWQWGYLKYEALVKAGGEKAWKEWVQAYMACMTFVDDQVGEVLTALEASPYCDNTVVVLTGDHGYHVGEKNCIQKWHLWDESTRVPLYVHVPGSPGNGQTCDHPVSLIDIYPTLLELCGLPGEPNEGRSNKRLDGHSLLPLLKAPRREDWNGPAVAFMGIRDGKFSAAADDDCRPHFSVRSNHFRYTLCGNGEEELYYHEEDPHEWTNLAGNPKYAETAKQLREELMQVLRATRIPEGFGSSQPKMGDRK
jgi:choline-sulfatase